MGGRRKPWVGESVQHRELLALIERVARNNVELLFTGETGVGKEQYARYAHERSPRRDRPFVPVNCGSIPADLVRNLTCVHPGQVIDASQLPLLPVVNGKNGHANGSFQQLKSSIVAEFEKKYLEEALDAAGGNIARAARTAGKPRRAFFELMRKHGIPSRR